EDEAGELGLGRQVEGVDQGLLVLEVDVDRARGDPGPPGHRLHGETREAHRLDLLERGRQDVARLALVAPLHDPEDESGFTKRQGGLTVSGLLAGARASRQPYPLPRLRRLPAPRRAVTAQRSPSAARSRERNPGAHQFQLPKSRMVAGTRRSRTSV